MNLPDFAESENPAIHRRADGDRANRFRALGNTECPRTDTRAASRFDSGKNSRRIEVSDQMPAKSSMNPLAGRSERATLPLIPHFVADAVSARSLPATLKVMAKATPDSPATDALSLGAVRHVAKLARLRLEDSEAERYRGQLAAILGHLSQLNAAEVADVEPMAHPLPLTNRLEDDVPSQAMPLADLLRNAPAVEGSYLAVPKVLGDGGGA